MKESVKWGMNKGMEMLACLVFCAMAITMKVQATEYQYDALGRIQAIQYENGDVVQYSYDANGNMLTYEYHADERKENENQDVADSGDTPEEGKSDRTNEGGDDKEQGRTDTANEGRDDKEQGRTEKKRTVQRGYLFSTAKAVYQVTGTGRTKTVSLMRLTDKKLKSFKIPAAVKIRGKNYKVTQIASGAFRDRKKLTGVTIGSNVTGVGSRAFYRCKKLKKIKIESRKMKTVGAQAFRGIAKKAVIRVPRSRYEKYKKLLRGKGQAKSVRIIQDK